MRRTGRWMGEWFFSVVAALQFLTRVPLPVRLPDNPSVFRRSTVFFPVAGLAVGAGLAGAGVLLDRWFPFYVTGVFVMAAWVVLTGGLHLDGLMDASDGLLSNQSRERMLEIMKDSRSGAMGVIAAVTVLLLKAALLAALFADGGRACLSLLVLVPVWSRTFLALAIAGWPYARQTGSLGSMYRTSGFRHALAAGVLAAGLTVPVLRGLAGFDTAGALAALALVAVLVYGTGSALAAAISRKLGGLTGDTYGALNEVLEVVLLAVAVGA